MASLAHRLGASVRAYRDVARSPSYAPLWAAQLVSSFGDTLHYVALVVLVYELTGRGAAVAVLVAAEIVPVLLLAPVAGVVIDRVSRKAVLIGADLGRAALALSLVWPQGAGHAYAVAAGLALGGVFFNPAVQAVIPAITTPEQRLAANAVAWSTGRLVQIVAAAVAGGLIGLAGLDAAFALNAATFAVSALFVLRLRLPARAGDLAASARRGLGGYVGDARAGLAYARGDRVVSRLLAVQALASLATGASGALLVVLAEEHLRLAPSGFAWLIGAIGAGALVGPLIPTSFALARPGPRWLFVPYLIRGGGDILLAVFTPLPVALAILFVYGLNTSTGMVVFNATLQDAVPDRVRGRVFTLFDVTWSAARLLSLAGGAVLADAIGVRALFWLGGVLLIGAGGLGLGLLGRRESVTGSG